MTWCSSCPSVHRSRNQEHAYARRTQSQRARQMGRRIAGTSATVCHPGRAMVPAIRILLSPPPPRGPRRSLVIGHVRVRACRYGFPPRLCAAQPRRFPGSNKQVLLVARPWTPPSQQASPSAQPTVGVVSVGRYNRDAVRDRRKHTSDLRVGDTRGQGRLRQLRRSDSAPRTSQSIPPAP